MDTVIYDVSTFFKNYDRTFKTDYLSLIKEHYSDKAENIDQLLASSLVIGTVGNDKLSTTNSNEIIWGDSGEDTINSGNGMILSTAEKATTQSPQETEMTLFMAAQATTQ